MKIKSSIEHNNVMIARQDNKYYCLTVWQEDGNGKVIPTESKYKYDITNRIQSIIAQWVSECITESKKLNIDSAKHLEKKYKKLLEEIKK